MAGDVGDVVGARRRGAAERAGAEVAVLVAVEGDAGVLEPQDLVRRLAAHDLDRVLVAEVVRALDRVERVRLPGVLGIQRRVDPAGGRDRVRAHGVDLGDDRDRCAGLRGRQRRALAGEAGADDQNVMGGHGRRFYGRRSADSSVTARGGAASTCSGPLHDRPYLDLCTLSAAGAHRRELVGFIAPGIVDDEVAGERFTGLGGRSVADQGRIDGSGDGRRLGASWSASSASSKSPSERTSAASTRARCSRKTCSTIESALRCDTVDHAHDEGGRTRRLTNGLR